MRVVRQRLGPVHVDDSHGVVPLVVHLHGPTRFNEVHGCHAGGEQYRGDALRFAVVPLAGVPVVRIVVVVGALALLGEYVLRRFGDVQLPDVAAEKVRCLRVGR